MQVEKGTGDREIRFGSAPGDVGSFYAYRGADEVLGGWRERVFSDITYAEQQAAHHVDGYRPLAIAPPDGNYGQAGTNDRHIPRELLARLLLSFPIVFTQDRSGIATAGASNPLGRIEVTGEVSDCRAARAACPRLLGLRGRHGDRDGRAVAHGHGGHNGRVCRPVGSWVDVDCPPGGLIALSVARALVEGELWGLLERQAVEAVQLER